MITLALVLFNGIASGYRETLSMIVKIYSEPLLDLGRGPTTSIMTCSKGAPIDGMGYKGAFGIT